MLPWTFTGLRMRSKTAVLAHMQCRHKRSAGAETAALVKQAPGSQRLVC